MQVVEAVLFNNELELLDARLHEGDGFVDRWVIIEALETFTGAPKPLHFHQNRRMFGDFNDRISHIVASPSTTGLSPWEREGRQRDELDKFLPSLSPDDVIVLSDGDELTRASCWSRITEATARGASVSLHKPTWYYTLTWGLPDAGPAVSSFRSKGARVSTLLDYGPTSWWANDLTFPVITHSGWHLSCLGGPARLLDKIQSFSHQEINTDGWATYENCQRLIKEGIDCAPFRDVPLTVSSPAGPKWLTTKGVEKYPWLLTGEDSCIPLS